LAQISQIVTEKTYFQLALEQNFIGIYSPLRFRKVI
jgi:hypothetical protein